ncbi:hypothetical protein F511_00636 [Dorcoceras hygrometricum]|nr:hypothetical protein F511_00636 [Dorcoceras hygrometricum]
MNPKNSDFDLARIFKPSVKEESTSNRVGTRGYMAPEYARQGISSVKSDIFNVGSLILEIEVAGETTASRILKAP